MKYLPSLLSFSRVICGIVFYVLLELYPLLPIFPLLALFFFVELSDFLDGYIARKFKATSNFGKLLDPVCDISAHFLCLFSLQKLLILPSIVLVVFVLREVWVTLLRAWLATRGIVFAARLSGKLKTLLYALVIFLGIASMPQASFIVSPSLLWPYFIALAYLSIPASLISGIEYVVVAIRSLR